MKPFWKFNSRKWYRFGNNKVIRVEVAGWNSSPSISLRVDGGDREVTFHISFFFGVWITLEHFFPDSWFPKEYNSYAKKWLHSAQRTIEISFHDWAVWWCLWRDDDVWNNHDWRHSSWHPFRNLKGKHTVEYQEVERRQFLLPFLEGNYNIEVTKNLRFDKWPRWFTRKMHTFDVRVGYYDGPNGLAGNWIEMCIPHEGKGENSWDQGEDGTFQMYFPARPHGNGRYGVNSCYDAALYFWESNMRTRERYGSAKWLPHQFKERELSFIKKQKLHG